MITLDVALETAQQTLAAVDRRATQGGYYSGARTDIINSHAELRAALDMLVKAAGPTAETEAASPTSSEPATLKP